MMQDIAHSADAFHRGDFWLVQPTRGGHRAGADSLILAAAVPSEFSGNLADFGSGAGAAGLAVASRCRGAAVTLVEQSPDMARFAAMTLEHPQNGGLSSRVSLLVADVSLSGSARESAGLARNSFDFVIMNPPFNAASDRASPNALRRQAHVMADGLFDSWIKSAAAVMRPGGSVAIIARPVSLGPILTALEKRFGAAEILPVHARPNHDALRIIVRARQGSRGPVVLKAPLFMHEQQGDGFSARAEAIFAGDAELFGT